MNKILWLAMVICILVLSGCQDSSTTEGTNNETKSAPEVKSKHQTYLDTKTGVGFYMLNTPQMADDLKRADQIGLVFFNAPYEGDGNIPEIIRVGFELGYTSLPVPNMAGSVIDPEGLKQAYTKLVNDYDPVYVGLGNEIELMKDKDEFVRIYNGLYDVIKQECSECIVYPVFQYEQFDASLVDQMKFDLLVFTSYPFAKYANIQDLPDHYYQEALQLAKKHNVKIAFTEIGWTYLDAFRSGYSTAEETQAAFIKKFKQLISDPEIELAFASWGLLYGAPQIGEEWADLGLYSQDSEAKQQLIDALLSLQ